MKATIKILGCGTSTGVPVPGCKCSVCTSNDPKNSRLRTSALISLETGENILIDAGVDLRQQALKYNISKIDAVLYTHSHSDHIFGTDDLRCFNFTRNGEPIPCYAEDFTIKEIKRVFNYLFISEPTYEGGFLARLNLNQIQVNTPFNLFGITIIPFRLMHGKNLVTGYKIGNLSYATDCNSIPEESTNIIKNNNEYFFLDGLRHKPHGTHFTISDAITASRKLNSKFTYFVHMTHDIDYESETKLLPDNFFYSYDGLEVEFIAK
jgi:phosphoribosyl 1,2-cyclic phosphate phosphodiesterase